MRPKGVAGLRSEVESGEEDRALLLAAKILEVEVLALVVEGGNTNEEKGDAVRLDSRLVVDAGAVVGSLSLSAAPPNKLDRPCLSILVDKGVLPNLARSAGFDPMG